MDATEQLLQIELEREARRKVRNRWLAALLVVALLFVAFVVWGVSSKNAADERSKTVQDIGRIYRNGG